MIPQRYYKRIIVGTTLVLLALLVILWQGGESSPPNAPREPDALDVWPQLTSTIDAAPPGASREPSALDDWPRPTSAIDAAPAYSDTTFIMWPNEAAQNYILIESSIPYTYTFHDHLEIRTDNSVQWSSTLNTGVMAPSTLGTGALASVGVHWPPQVAGERWECPLACADSLTAAARVRELYGNQYDFRDWPLCFAVGFSDEFECEAGCCLVGYSGYTFYLTTMRKGINE